jgi:signal transduction histidine kinase
VSTAAGEGFARQVVSVALLVRLGAIAVGMVGLIGQTMTGSVLLCVLALSAVSFSCLTNATMLDFVVRHPLVLVVEILVTLGVIGMLGSDSPLVLGTFSTAMMIGLLFDRRVAAVATVVLVAGYTLVERLNDDESVSTFMTQLGVPALYLCLVAIGSTVQVANRRQAEASHALAVARESVAAADERARLAREMHDSLGKTLHGIALAADALPTWVEKDPRVASRQAEGIADGARQAAAEARSLLVRLRMDQPDRPLVAVLAHVCERWQEEHATRCDFRYEGVVDLSTDARYELLAIVNEALENIARHARASAVDVTLRAAGGGAVEIVVADDGDGFVPQLDGTSPRGHFGLTGMSERARAAGATLRIDSEPGRGTRVTVRQPLKELVHDRA